MTKPIVVLRNSANAPKHTKAMPNLGGRMV